MLEHRPLHVSVERDFTNLIPTRPPRSAVPQIIGRLLTLARTCIFPALRCPRPGHASPAAPSTSTLPENTTSPASRLTPREATIHRTEDRLAVGY